MRRRVTRILVIALPRLSEVPACRDFLKTSRASSRSTEITAGVADRLAYPPPSAGIKTDAVPGDQATTGLVTDVDPERRHRVGHLGDVGVGVAAEDAVRTSQNDPAEPPDRAGRPGGIRSTHRFHAVHP
jgi:hypothetical protein